MASTWSKAPCGVVLGNQLDQLHPGRPNDGTVGDLSHQARPSDHNPREPRPPGWVDARDVYDYGALDANALMHRLVGTRDPRILYVISHGQMCSSYPARGFPAWAWRPYSGPNGHFTHGHISFVAERRHDLRPWDIGGDSMAMGFPRTISRKDHGGREFEVKLLRHLLHIHGHKIHELDSSSFGIPLHDHVVSYQKHRGLVADGIVGNKTWERMMRR